MTFLSLFLAFQVLCAKFGYQHEHVTTVSVSKSPVKSPSVFVPGSPMKSSILVLNTNSSHRVQRSCQQDRQKFVRDRVSSEVASFGYQQKNDSIRSYLTPKKTGRKIRKVQREVPKSSKRVTCKIVLVFPVSVRRQISLPDSTTLLTSDPSVGFGKKHCLSTKIRERRVDYTSVRALQSPNIEKTCTAPPAGSILNPDDCTCTRETARRTMQVSKASWHLALA